jgi:hypothetical protein
MMIHHRQDRHKLVTTADLQSDQWLFPVYPGPFEKERAAIHRWRNTGRAPRFRREQVDQYPDDGM